MNQSLQFIVTILVAVIGSSGMWAFFEKRHTKRDTKTQMLIGLGHDRIVYLGMKYIERGNITKNEYENLIDYLYKPYEAMGGNGSAKRIVDEVKKLPIVSDTNY